MRAAHERSPARLVRSVLLLLALGVAAGCVGSREAGRPRDRGDANRAAWIERRANQLAAAGLGSREAAAKAAADWSALTGDEREAILLRPASASRAREEQRKVNAGLDELARGR